MYAVSALVRGCSLAEQQFVGENIKGFQLISELLHPATDSKLLRKVLFLYRALATSQHISVVVAALVKHQMQSVLSEMVQHGDMDVREVAMELCNDLCARSVVAQRMLQKDEGA